MIKYLMERAEDTAPAHCRSRTTNTATLIWPGQQIYRQTRAPSIAEICAKHVFNYFAVYSNRLLDTTK